METLELRQFEQRKREHIEQSLSSAHQATGLSGLDRVHLVHDALPELDFEQITLSAIRLEKPVSSPFFVAAMTAGHESANELNRVLALGCVARGWAMGVGSQRRELSAGPSVDSWRRLRDEVPGLTFFANLGASQLLGTSMAQLQGIVDALGAEALVVHLNALQECLQPEGTPQYSGVTEALRSISLELKVPVVVKETGCGFSERALSKLQVLGLKAVDVSGLGGTHWGRIEGARALSAHDAMRAMAAQTFSEWGESTVSSVLAARLGVPELEVWASGGVRSGLDAAKLIALGASQVGFAKPALEAALLGLDSLKAWMTKIEFELKVALFCTGCASPIDLKQREGVWNFKREN